MLKHVVLAGSLEPTFHQLEVMKLDKSPFVIISVVGQELLGASQYAAAVVVLESALRIGTCSLKLRGSVFSALSSAYWALNKLDKVLQNQYASESSSYILRSLKDSTSACISVLHWSERRKGPGLPAYSVSG